MAFPRVEEDEIGFPGLHQDGGIRLGGKRFAGAQVA
jgi:hypothetical protein